VEGVRTGAGRAMGPDMRKRFLIVLAAVVAVLFVGGMVAAFMSRNDTICSDGKAPVAQRDVSLGQIEYRCHDGEIVRK
jgi:hypothetical protein